MHYLRKQNWELSISQRIGIFIVLFFVLVLELILNFQQTKETLFFNQADKTHFLALENELSGLIDEKKTNRNFTTHKFISNKKDSLKSFDPNKLPLQGWEKLGFTSKQAEVIMKYKQLLGGKFESKDQLKKCFVISDEIFAFLSPYILLPEKTKKEYRFEKSQNFKQINYTRFNPNTYSEKEWMKIGFSRKQAEVILKYKQIVGGEFTSKEQLKKCFVISEEKFFQMASYILLPDKEPKVERELVIAKEFLKEEKKTEQKLEEKVSTIKEKINPNQLDLNGWISLGFTDKQAQTILNFKRSLGGKFKDAKTLSRSYVISAEKFKEIEPNLIFD